MLTPTLLDQVPRKIRITRHRTLIWATVINDVIIAGLYSGMRNGLKDNRMRERWSIICVVDEIDDSVNKGRGPYVFNMSGQMYHWIGSLCPEEGQQPCFLQLYIYDTDNECSHLELQETNSVPDFKIRLHNMGGVRGYELPTSQGLGGIVFESSARSRTDYDVIIEQPGYYPKLKLKPQDGSGRGKKVLMNKYYKYRLHPRVNDYGLIFKGGRIFQQYVVTVYCALEQDHIDYPEIKRYMAQYTELTPADRPDIVCQVFEQKVDPKDKIEIAEQVDQYILAELPDLKEDPIRNKIVSDIMMHSPCGVVNSNAPYMQKGLDRILAKINKPIGKTSTLAGNNPIQIDEIQNFDDEPVTNLSCRVRSEDRELDIALKEATVAGSSSELRSLFMHILIYCEVADPSKLWTKHLTSMGDDIPAKCQKQQAILNGYGKSVKDFGLPDPPPHLLEDLKNKFLMEEKNYKSELLMQEKIDLVPKLNTDQRRIYDIIIHALANNQQELIFIYGHGGTRKTFFWKTITSTLRSEGKIVLAVVSSGNCLAPSACRYLMDAPNVLFGGKTVVLGGDFRQTLPVKKRASKFELIKYSIAESELWWHFRVCTLTQNMRLLKPILNEEEQRRSQEFVDSLLHVGNGELGEPDEENAHDTYWLDIPAQFCVTTDEKGTAELIKFIYNEETLKMPTTASLQEKAIVCPKNDTADAINAQI
ncbi:DNA helicase [Tanacetum coccineum]